MGGMCAEHSGMMIGMANVEKKLDDHVIKYNKDEERRNSELVRVHERIDLQTTEVAKIPVLIAEYNKKLLQDLKANTITRVDDRVDYHVSKLAKRFVFWFLVSIVGGGIIVTVSLLIKYTVEKLLA